MFRRPRVAARPNISLSIKLKRRLLEPARRSTLISCLSTKISASSSGSRPKAVTFGPTLSTELLVEFDASSVAGAPRNTLTNIRNTLWRQSLALRARTSKGGFVRGC
jgi:hypothetical protein